MNALTDNRIWVFTKILVLGIVPLLAFPQGGTLVAVPSGFNQIPNTIGVSHFQALSRSDVFTQFMRENNNIDPGFYLPGIYSRIMCQLLEQKPGCSLPDLPDIQFNNGIGIVNGALLRKKDNSHIIYTLTAAQNGAHGWFVFVVPDSALHTFLPDAHKFQELWWTYQMYPSTAGVTSADRLNHLRALQVQSGQFWRGLH